MNYSPLSGRARYKRGAFNLIVTDRGDVYTTEEERRLIDLIEGRKYDEALLLAQRIEKEI